MGFVNNIKFKKRPLPDGVESDDFTTKDLEFGCLFYEITKEGRLVRDNEDGTFTEMEYTGELYVNTYIGYRSYFLTFDENGFLSEVNEVHYSKDLSTTYEKDKDDS